MFRLLVEIINMQYIKIEFTSGYDGFDFQEIENGEVRRLTDMDGNTINQENTESKVVDANPELLEWMNA